MDDNPYRSPEAPLSAPVVGVLSGSREDLRRVAKYQRGLLMCVLVYFVSLAVPFVLPENLFIIAQIGVGIAGIVGLVFVFLLSTKIYGTGAGILLGMLTLIPCVGLIVLLIINQRATTVLRQNGIRVGLLGADPNAI
jgi:asparagine N-glycosylation enzyme membrane subunit Stt3